MKITEKSLILWNFYGILATFLGEIFKLCDIVKYLEKRVFLAFFPCFSDQYESLDGRTDARDGSEMTILIRIVPKNVPKRKKKYWCCLLDSIFLKGPKINHFGFFIRSVNNDSVASSMIE